MIRNGFLWLLTTIIILGTCGSAFARQHGSEGKTMDFAGKWWLSVSSLEQRGYINGNFDCDTWEVGNKSASSATAEGVQKFVSQFYEDPAHWSFPVFRVIRTFESERARALKKSTISGGEVWNKPHGYWDGLWWKGAGYPNALEQLGYVEGFLACYRDEAHTPKRTFSKSPAEYVSLISDWYKRREKEDAKIADVLFGFADHPERFEPKNN